MDREFYLKFIDACARERDHLKTLQSIIESHLKSPVEIMVRVKEGNDLPLITAHLQKESGLIRPQGGLATIPAAFEDQKVRLVPVFIHETEKIEERYLDYEAVHIEALLDRAGEYANYRRYFLNPPQAKTSDKEKLDYLKHIARRILTHDQIAFPRLHPGKEKKTIRSLLLYQLGERLAWYIGKLEIDEDQAVAELSRTLDEFAAQDPFYKDFDVSGYFKQTLVALTLFK